ncbi:hypothetical protein N7539_004705 [Penicillium diatomitis]|uniref:C2H2-type domain-containing protein n=1 Tax=Penicillium diatomitis TaxID=2819901 RepID=A0A9W9X5K1_9EURO|nr:uncharacterized protein N7539_004705 [Penicillium diatomitis]KAJ5484717.1 hypothetical protein N7539_004705 [Penicillium diatomitis]
MTALAVPAVPGPGMGTSLEGLSSQPLNSRRPAAPTLPSFELPPPPFGLAVGAHGQCDLLGPQFVLPVESPSVRVGDFPPTTDGLSQPYEAPPMASFSQALPAPSTSTLASGPHPVTLGLYQPNHTASAASLPSNDPYNSKVHSMYASPGQHTGYSPLYAGPNPLGGHGHPGMHPGARMPLQSPGGQPPVPYPRQPWPSYSLPAMSGPVMSNVHSPNSPLSMMGGMPSGVLPGFNSGHLANTQHLYGAHSASHHGMPGPVADRPFKCDQCPQSFNRNHDLKRHKRIHLAVKPFPCAHCDKSFSRKDALKRHILVKGCGTATASDSNGALTGENGTLKIEGSGDDLSPLANGRN